MFQPLHAPDVDARRAEQEQEYGTFVAAGPIYVGTALAYNEGDPVPASNVEAHGYEADGLVTRVAKPAAKSSSSKASASGASTDGAK